LGCTPSTHPRPWNPTRADYYSSLIVFFGAEFTHAWATRQRTVEPMPYAEPGAALQTKSEAVAEQAALAEDSKNKIE
jgi:hypothetical protein